MSPEPARECWYVAKGGKQHGPFTSSRIAALAKAGRIGPCDLIRRDGGNFVPAGTVRGLTFGTAEPVAQNSPPALPLDSRRVPAPRQITGGRLPEAGPLSGQHGVQQGSSAGAGEVAVARRPLGVFVILVAGFVGLLLWTLGMAGWRALGAGRSEPRPARPPAGAATRREPPPATVTPGTAVAAWPQPLAALPGNRPVITATLTDIASEPEAYVGKIIRTSLRLNGFSMASFRRKDAATGKAFRCWTVMAWDGVRPLGTDTVGSQYHLSENELNVVLLKDGMGRGIQDALNANGVTYFGTFGALATVQALALNGEVYELLVIHRVDAVLADGKMSGAISEEAFAN